MAGQPGRLEKVLCARGVPRPVHGGQWPGAAHCTPHSSIACNVRPASASRAGGHLRVTLQRRDQFAGACAGRLRVKLAEHTASKRFDFGTATEISVRLPLSGPGSAAITARPYEAYPRTRTVLVD
jgi:hypothetical protein